MATKAQNKKVEVAQSPAPKVAAATPAVATGSTTAAVAAPANGKSGGVNPPAANAKQVEAIFLIVFCACLNKFHS